VLTPVSTRSATSRWPAPWPAFSIDSMSTTCSPVGSEIVTSLCPPPCVCSMTVAGRNVRRISPLGILHPTVTVSNARVIVVSGATPFPSFSALSSSLLKGFLLFARQ